MSTVHAPYNLEVADTCLNCQLRGRGYFCHLAGEELQALAAISYSTVYPEGSVLFVEGQMPRGVYILCRGKAKLSMVSKEGKTLILRISEPGDVLGLSSCLLSQPYQGTVETLTPCQVNFIRREDFLRYIRSHANAMFRVAEFLSREYQSVVMRSDRWDWPTQRRRKWHACSWIGKRRGPMATAPPSSS